MRKGVKVEYNTNVILGVFCCTFLYFVIKRYNI